MAPASVPTIHGATARCGALAVLALVAFGAEPAQADSLEATYVEPAERGTPWLVLDGVDYGSPGQLAVGVAGALASRTFRQVQLDGSELRTATQVDTAMHVGASYAFLGFLRVGADVSGVPATASAQLHDGLPSSTPVRRLGVGNVRLAVDGRAWGRADGPLRVGLGMRLYIPPTRAEGDGRMRLAPQLTLAGDVWLVRWALRAAWQLAPADAAGRTPVLRDGLQLAGGVGLRLWQDVLSVGLELSVLTQVRAAGGPSSAPPIEALLGLRYQPAPMWRVSLGATAGLTRSFELPAVAGLVALEWALDVVRPAPSVPVAELGLEREGAAHSVDAFAEDGGLAATDQGEGAGARPVRNALAASAPWPVVSPPAGAPSGGEMARTDADGDTIPDALDGCPHEAGPSRAERAKHGCPVGAIVGAEVVVDPVSFVPGSAQFAKEGAPVLQRILKALQRLPVAQRLLVEGHTDNAGDRRQNLQLSERRARAVVAWLAAHGLDRRRFQAKGAGPDRPVASNVTSEGRAQNRRVTFTLIPVSERPR